MAGSWGCPHEANDFCSKVNNLPCDPGMKGCVLHGRFVFANESPYDTMDPHAAFDVGRVAVRLNLYDGLYRWLDNPAVLQPWLAESPRFPSDRAFPGAATTDPWSREQVEIVGATGAINHYDATRTITLASPSAKWLPMVIQTLWVRLAIRTTTATAGVSLPKLQIVAHIGGHAEEQALETLTTPYQNNY